MKKTSNKIATICVFSAILFLVGFFLFSHFQISNLNLIGIAHAQNTGLHADLSGTGTADTGWVFTIWKISLALANVIVMIMLLFVAIVNIVHLQYDTYAIKKSLPLLIIGIIMANFSLLICRMIVDAATVLANTFASDPAGLAHDLLCGMGVANSTTGAAAATIITVLTAGTGTIGIMLIIVIITLVAVLIAILILSFLLWIRKIIIFLLVAMAPVAFILYAFPPTQSIFKQWWSWFLKWVFMGPIVMFLIWAAAQIGSNNCTNPAGFSISALLSMCGVLYLAAIVPFKLGGPVMGAWAGLGKKLASPATNAAKANYDRKRDVVKGAAGEAWGNTRVGSWMNRGRKNEEGLIANYKTRSETRDDQAALAAKQRHRNWDADEIRAERAKKDLQRDKEANNAEFYRTPEGRRMIDEEINDQMVTGRLTIAKQDQMFDISLVRGREISEFKNSVANSQMRVEKLEDDQKVVIAGERLADFEDLPDTLRGASRAVDDAQVARGMIHPDDAAGLQHADQNLAQARQNLVTERQNHIQTLQGQVNPRTNQNYTADEAVHHVEANLLQQYQVTRNYAIIGKRVNDDSTTDSQSQDSSVIVGGYLNQHGEGTGGSYGPYQWHVDVDANGHAEHAIDANGQPTGHTNDIESFFHGQRLSQRNAALGVATGIDSLKKKMTNNRTMGYAMQDYMRMASAGNAGGMNAVIHQARNAMSQDDRNEFEDNLQQRGIQGSGANGAYTADDYRQYIANNALDTSTPGSVENRLATKLFGELQRADGAEAGVVDKAGATHQVVTGLGRQAWWYARHQ